MTLLLIWFVLAIIVSVAGAARGRSGIGWFVLAVILSPLIAGLIVAVLPDLKTRAMLEKLVEVHRVDDRALQRAIEPRAYGAPPQLFFRTAAALTIGVALLGVTAYVVNDDPAMTAIISWLQAAGLR